MPGYYVATVRERLFFAVCIVYIAKPNISRRVGTSLPTGGYGH